MSLLSSDCHVKVFAAHGGPLGGINAFGRLGFLELSSINTYMIYPDIPSLSYQHYSPCHLRWRFLTSISTTVELACKEESLGDSCEQH